VVGEGLVGKAVNRLPVLRRFDAVPASVPQHPCHVPIAVERTGRGEGARDRCPDPAGQPPAFIPGQSSQNVVHHSGLIAEAARQIFNKDPESIRRQVDIESFRILQRAAGDAGIEENPDCFLGNVACDALDTFEVVPVAGIAQA
jgi:hypothetical protein